MNEKSSPLLSVVVPNYNQAAYLKASLAAIVNQSFQGFELIIIDDASTDESVEIIRKYQKKHSKIKFLQNKKNEGVVKSFNRGIELSKGKYLACCSSDDKILPSFFEKGVKLLESYPQAGLFVSDPIFFDKKQNRIEKLLNVKKAIFLSPSSLIKLCKNTHFWIPGHTTLYRKDLFVKHGGFQESFQHLSDWYLNHTIALQHGVIYLPEVLSVLRLRVGSFSQKLNVQKIKKIKILFNLFDFVSSKENQKIALLFKKSTLFARLGNDLFIFLLLKPKYWNYLPSFCLKKARNFVRKFLNKKMI